MAEIEDLELINTYNLNVCKRKNIKLKNKNIDIPCLYDLSFENKIYLPLSILIDNGFINKININKNTYNKIKEIELLSQNLLLYLNKFCDSMQKKSLDIHKFSIIDNKDNDYAKYIKRKIYDNIIDIIYFDTKYDNNLTNNQANIVKKMFNCLFNNSLIKEDITLLYDYNINIISNINDAKFYSNIPIIYYNKDGKCIAHYFGYKENNSSIDVEFNKKLMNLNRILCEENLGIIIDKSITTYILSNFSYTNDIIFESPKFSNNDEKDIYIELQKKDIEKNYKKIIKIFNNK